MSDQPPDGGRDAFTRDKLQQIARMIDEELPDKWGFALFAFPFGNEPGKLNYVAKGNREDIIAMITEWMKQTGGELKGHQ